jgi:putative transposase
VLLGLVVLRHQRRQVVHFGVTENPTAQWTAQQIVEAVPWDDAPPYLLRDRDEVHGTHSRQRLRGLGIEEVITAPQSPWQNPYAERLIGSSRRECLGHVIVLNEEHLRRVLKRYFSYYHYWRPHLSLDGDCPESRIVQNVEAGEIVEVPEVGGGCTTTTSEGRPENRRPVTPVKPVSLSPHRRVCSSGTTARQPHRLSRETSPSWAR